MEREKREKRTEKTLKINALCACCQFDVSDNAHSHIPAIYPFIISSRIALEYNLMNEFK